MLTLTRCFGLVALLGLGASACTEAVPECAPGELRYNGRPPPRLFAYDQSCRADCFSMPRQKDCDQTCDTVASAGPAGLLYLDRQLVLADLTSLGPDHALTYDFAFVDEAGGSAPQGWGFVAQGPRSYLTDEIVSTARFVMHAAVSPLLLTCTGACGVGMSCVDVGELNLCLGRCDPAVPACGEGLACAALPNPEGFPGVCVPAGGVIDFGTRVVGLAPVGEALAATPGRLEMLSTAGGRLSGRFFLGFETPTAQPQGEVLGCFDLGLGPQQGTAGANYWRLGP